MIGCDWPVCVCVTVCVVSGDDPVCRPTRLPGQHEGAMGAAQPAHQVLRGDDQGDAAIDRSAARQTQLRQRLRFPAQQVRRPCGGYEAPDSAADLPISYNIIMTIS